MNLLILIILYRILWVFYLHNFVNDFLWIKIVLIIFQTLSFISIFLPYCFDLDFQNNQIKAMIVEIYSSQCDIFTIEYVRGRYFLRYLYQFTFRMNKQWGPTVQHRELCPVTWGRTWWKRAWEKEYTYIYIHTHIWLGHCFVQ